MMELRQALGVAQELGGGFGADPGLARELFDDAERGRRSRRARALGYSAWAWDRSPRTRAARARRAHAAADTRIRPLPSRWGQSTARSAHLRGGDEKAAKRPQSASPRRKERPILPCRQRAEIAPHVSCRRVPVGFAPAEHLRDERAERRPKRLGALAGLAGGHLLYELLVRKRSCRSRACPVSIQ